MFHHNSLLFAILSYLYRNYRNSEVVLSSLIKRKADLNESDANGWTALHFAASQGHTQYATVLLDHGAEIDLGVLKPFKSQNISFISI